MKYPPYNTSSIVVYDQLVFILSAFAIAIWRFERQALAIFLLAEQDALDFAAQITQVIVVHQTAEVQHFRTVPLAVQAVQHGNKAASQAGKNNITDMDKTTKNLYGVADNPGTYDGAGIFLFKLAYNFTL